VRAGTFALAPGEVGEAEGRPGVTEAPETAPGPATPSHASGSATAAADTSASARPPARAAARVAVTRERILAVALELFAERGFAGTSVRDISEALGVSKAALYYHFTSKDEILDAVVTPVIDRVETFAQTAGHGAAGDPHQVFADLVDVLAATACALAPFANDPSVLHHSARTRGLKGMFEGIVQRLAETVPGPFAVLRARCAIGAVQGAVFATVMPGNGSPPAEGTESDQSSQVARALAPDLREQIVEAAMRALGGVSIR
jgi:AcrR family transcriptional regulator